MLGFTHLVPVGLCIPSFSLHVSPTNRKYMYEYMYIWLRVRVPTKYLVGRNHRTDLAVLHGQVRTLGPIFQKYCAPPEGHWKTDASTSSNKV